MSLTARPWLPRAVTRFAAPPLAALLGAVLPVAAHAQVVNQQTSINGLSIAPAVPLLERADAPPAGSPLPDPSLANAFNYITTTGINLNGVGNYIIPDPDDSRFIFSCSASRIGPSSILTAAHCVTDDNTGALLSTAYSSEARFLGPGSMANAPQFYDFTDVQSVVVDPLWHGFDNPATYDATDFAVVNFATPLPSWITTYGLYTGDPLGAAATDVGFGTYGTGSGPTGFDFGRRWGTNQVDYEPTNPNFSDFLDLYTDFDQPGNPQYDAFCMAGVVCDTGLSTEAGTAEGDSGGPLFIDGMIAGVTSFGTYFCDPTLSTAGNCVPFGSDPSRPFDDFGSLHGFAPVFASADFITEAETPEPGTIALTATGLLAMGAAARRRRRA